MSCLCTDVFTDAYEAKMDGHVKQGAESGPVDIPEVKVKVDDVNKNVFTISFDKGRGYQGIRFAHVDSLLVISDVGSDALAQWNSVQSNKDTVLQPMDRVVAVNGEKGSAEDLLGMIHQEGNVSITLEHPRYLSIALKRKKKEKLLGVEVAAEESLGVVILNLQDRGLFPDYNSNAEPELQIKARLEDQQLLLREALVGLPGILEHLLHQREAVAQPRT
ncbi:PGA [Symbiodinium natans]|uniref:PGA protein n=1 Tax=Symbiodinium natans TaxID=878477 RepID=A0A812U312_9DINO|nr:PGA [Symbiodinium natans]